MTWPSISDIQAALANPAECFNDAELRACSPRRDEFGLPLCLSGTGATVWPLDNGTTSHALRLPQRADSSHWARYRKLAPILNKKSLSGLHPVKVLTKGIRINGQWNPGLKIPWIEGQDLRSFIRTHIDDAEVLNGVQQHLRRLNRCLSTNGIAHGDWQHGNILIDSSGQPSLVDYDGMFAPALRSRQSPILGHPNYQHPERGPMHFSASLDNFSAHVIDMALTIYRIDPAIWDLRGPGNPKLDDACILFRRDDYECPRTSDTVQLLRDHDSPTLQLIGSQLEHLLEMRPSGIPMLPAPRRAETAQVTAPSWMVNFTLSQ